MTRGARVIDSVPPATKTSPSPAAMACAAATIADMPEPQRRLMVWPGTDIGSPASRTAIRPTLRLSSPAWLAAPRITSSMDAGSIPVRSTTARMTWAARSSGRARGQRPAVPAEGRPQPVHHDRGPGRISVPRHSNSMPRSMLGDPNGGLASGRERDPVTMDRPWPLPRPGIRRAWWLREALATEQVTGGTLPAPPLRGREIADVAIVGGGYTGMWTAYFLTERDPGMRIVILEQDICGGGPSGRNGGFVHGWWEQLPYLAKKYGPAAALEIARGRGRGGGRDRGVVRRARGRRVVSEGGIPGGPRLSRRGERLRTLLARPWRSSGVTDSSSPGTRPASRPCARPRRSAMATGCRARPRSSRPAWRVACAASSSSGAW